MRRRSPGAEALESLAGLGDGQLLDRFREGGSALAFEALMARHGPMVLSACRGALGDRHAAEDAFQVVFLTLARRAGSIRDRDSVATWLLGVARRVAAHALRADRRRLVRERRRGLEGGGGHQLSTRDLGPIGEVGVLDELARLPERQRAAVVLCYLEGHTCDEAARILGWPVGTVKSRLSRARTRLRARLGPPGLAAPIPAPPVPARLAEATARLVATGPPFPTSTTLLATAPGATMSPTFAPWNWPLVAFGATLGLTLALATPGPDPSAPAPRAAEEPEITSPRAPRDLGVRAGAGSTALFRRNARGEKIAVDAADPARSPFREEIRDLRWVAIVATLDDRAARAAEALDRKLDRADPAARPSYIRAEVERQIRRPAGDWSSWTAVDLDRNYDILDNIARTDPDPVPEPLRPPTLVDPLPALRSGSWAGIYPESLVEPEPIQPGESPKDRPARFKLATRPLFADRTEPDPEQPILLIRFLDFTVEPGLAYRYRSRVAVRDPAQPGRQPADEIHWPWSAPSAEAEVR